MIRLLLPLLCLSITAACSSAPSEPAPAAPAASAVPAAATAEPPAAAEMRDLQAKYSLDQLTQASNYLTTLGTAAPKRGVILKCDDKDTAMQWASGQLRALTDEKIATEREAYNKSPASFASRIQGCSRTCTCSSYAMILEGVEAPVTDKAEHKKNAKMLKSELARSNDKQALKCASKAKWFCESPLRDFLKRNG